MRMEWRKPFQPTFHLEDRFKSLHIFVFFFSYVLVNREMDENFSTQLVSPLSQTPILIVLKDFQLGEVDSEQLARHSTNLLQYVSRASPTLMERYRLQLVKVDGGVWKLQICLDPLEWYQYLRSLPNNEPSSSEGEPSKPNYIIAAERYLEWVYSNSHRCIEPKKKTKPVEMCRYDLTSQGCTYVQCRFDHTLWECKAKVDHHVRGEIDYGFFCKKSLTVQAFDNFDPNWTAFIRPEKTRDIVIVPHPKYIYDAPFPHSNYLMVQTSLFWNTAAKFANRLCEISKDASAVERIVVNFGEWETAVHDDVYLKECHAHFHLWLSANSVRAIPQLDGFDFPPNDYLWINAVNLQQTLLWYDQQKYTGQQMGTIMRMLQNLQDKVPPPPDPSPSTLQRKGKNAKRREKRKEAADTHVIID